MIKFAAIKFHDDLLRLEGELDRHVIESPEISTFTQDQKSRLIGVIKSLEAHCREQELNKTLSRAVEFRGELEWVPQSWCSDFDKEHLEPKTDFIFKSCDAIKIQLHNELQERKFAYIPVEKTKYFEQEALFGKDVNDKCSEEVRADIKQAGNCIAADLHTAAVFHFMRVAELGLRAMARKFKIKKIGARTLEYVTLEKLIGTIEDHVDSILNPPTRPSVPLNKKREMDLHFYRGLLVDAKYFKDVNRNPLSHVRTVYTESDALNVYSHVRDFTQRIAPRLSETNKI